MTDKNTFANKIFLSLNISDFHLFFMWQLHPLPPKKVTPSFPATSLQKLRSCQATPLLKIVVGGSNPSCRKSGGAHYDSPRSSLYIHLSNYWWAGISNYFYGSISVITKIYVFVFYFASVSLLIMRSQPALIAWKVTSTAAFCRCWSHTEYSDLWIGCVVCISY